MESLLFIPLPPPLPSSGFQKYLHVDFVHCLHRLLEESIPKAKRQELLKSCYVHRLVFTRMLETFAAMIHTPML